ncbi:MAG: adenylate/guanylate cyclase domain-containing protein [Leptospira sp.]|nr:adenylate/guanylate cyclase domain-containing protein [Leptospira sp.]
MLEISPDIPFLSDTKIRFLVWDRAPRSLEIWNWSEGLYCFLQSRSTREGKEFRYGSPLWGIPNYVNYIEYPFYTSSDSQIYSELGSAWKETLKQKTITILAPYEDEAEIRLEFAKLFLKCNPNQTFEQVGKNFGLVGETYLLLNEFARVIKKEIPSQNQFFKISPPILIHSSQKPIITNIETKNKDTVLVSKLEPITIQKDEREIFNANSAESINNSNTELEITTVKSSEKESEIKNTTLYDPEVKVDILEKDKKEEISIPAPKSEIIETPVDKIIETQEKASTKFSIQLKMMGVISVLFILTVSTIIFFASNFFRNTSELQLRDNNLRMAEIVGSKVGSDVLNAVERGKQIAFTLTTQGIGDEQKNKLLKSFFESDKEFIYLGIYEKNGEDLVNKREVFNEEELKLTSLTEEDFHNVVKRNKGLFAEAFSGQPVLINSSPGFQEPSFAIAIPTEENGKLDNILVMIIKLEKIIDAFEKKGIETTFLVNGAGIVIAHPKEDLVLSATDLSSMPIVRTMLTSAAATGQTSYLDEELKSQFLGSFKKIGFADTGVVTIVSEDKAFEAVYNIQKRNIYIMGIGLCIALIFVFFFSKTITKPILHLLSATLQIAKGDFQIGIKPTTRDEVGLLTEYFIEMGQGLEEREKVKNILGSMIDPVVVQEAMVDLAALKRGSEAQITAFFSDVAGFSTISEQLKSADLAALLNEYLSAMTLILKQHEGVLDKYIGDAIVGIFSAPVIVSEHQLKAARASVEMIQKLKELRKYWKDNNLYSKEAQEMDCRIGLNSGPAKVGFMGTDALASYTMMGDTVNLAARLEAAGKDYGVNILITDAIQKHLQDEMITRYLDLVRVKGKNEPVRIHELVGYKSTVSSAVVEACRLYEQGFEAYLERDWNKAITYFIDSEKARGEKDKSCHVLIERCEEYKEFSPGVDWDGVFTRTHK